MSKFDLRPEETAIREIDGKWYAFAIHDDQCRSIGADSNRTEDGRVERAQAVRLDKGVLYVASPSPSKAAAIAKARRAGKYMGEY